MVPQRFIKIQSTARVLIIAIVAAYCLPNSVAAQTANLPAENQAGQNQPQASPSAPQPSQSSGQETSTTASSAQQPQSDKNAQQPVTTYPDPAAATQQDSPDAPQPKAQQKDQAQSEPQGAATAEKVPTAGGAAAKPAGVAIAPGKQHQGRSLLIKVGAVLAAGAAAGTVYALSRGTSSTPPGATNPNVTQKK